MSVNRHYIYLVLQTNSAYNIATFPNHNTEATEQRNRTGNTQRGTEQAPPRRQSQLFAIPRRIMKDRRTGRVYLRHQALDMLHR